MKTQLTNFIKRTAIEIGFDACGLAKANFLADDAVFLKNWLDNGFQGEMQYLERNFDKRTDPRILVEGCKSVIVVLMNYFPRETQLQDAPRIAKYAFSKIDYHSVIKEKLFQLEDRITENFGKDCFNENHQHIFVDSAPVLERSWAQKAGLGWIGRNQMLINPAFGSFCFIGTMLINKELEFGSPIKNRCGTCTKCLQACPTQALSEKDGLNANRCISYQTIEKKGHINEEISSKLNSYAFGCDICNDVCPWNKSRAKAHNHPELEIIHEIIDWQTDDWNQLDKEKFDIIFKKSAIKRAGFDKLKQNIASSLQER